MQGSLRAKTIFFTVAVALVPLLVLSLALLGISYSAKREDVLAQQTERAQRLADQTGRTIDEIEQALDVVGRTSNWSALAPQDQQLLIDTLYSYRTLGQSRTGFGAFDEVLLLDGNGDPVAGHSSVRLMTLEAWAKQAREAALNTVLRDETYRGPVYVSAGVVSTMDIAVPARSLPGTTTGLLWGAINLDKALWPVIAAPGMPEASQVYLLDGQGHLFVRNDEHVISGGQALSGLWPASQITQGFRAGTKTYVGLAGEQVVGAWQPVEMLDWTVVVETPTRVAFADIRRLLTPAILLSLVTIALAGGAGVLASQILTRPVEHLRAGVEIMGGGNLDYRITLRRQDEIGQLAHAFNQMASNLKASQLELRNWAQELEQRVKARTRELAAASQRMERRAAQLQVSAEIAHAIASLRLLQELLPEVTRLISQQFGWYHVGIFLLDEAGEYAVLRAANSEGGQRMLQRGHRLQVGQQGIVGSVTSSGQARIAEDVGADAVYFDNPDLPDTRSEMTLPLHVGERVIGALDVQSTEPAAYDNEDVVLLGTLADQVAIAIENARLFEQTQKALDRVQSLHRQYVQREWSALTSRQQNLTFEYRRAGVPVQASSLPAVATAALKSGDAVATDLEASGEGSSDGSSSRPAELAAPIKLRDQIIGVLDVQDLEGSRYWTEDEIVMVRAISDQVGQALENARLFAETSRRAEQMSTLHKIGLDLASGLELERVLQSLHEQCRQVLPIDTFYVALYDDNSGQVRFPLFAGVDGPVELEPQDIRHEQSLAGYIIESGQPLYIADALAIPDGAPYHLAPVSGVIIRSYIGVPLTSRGRVIGALSVQSHAPNVYTDEDMALLTTVAVQASIAIENARAYERLVETAEELRELDRLKMQFLANMSHELRTPLNSIIGFSRVILKGIDGPLTELQETDLNSIYNSGQHLLGLINDVLDMSKIEAGKMDLNFEQVLLPNVLGSVMSSAKALVKDKPIELKSVIPDDLPAVRADVQRLRQVLLNLLSNAAKFTEQGKITVGAEASGGFATVSVSDTGIGIAPEAQQRIFLAFQQVDGSTTRRAEGTGLGLAISRSFVELHGGQIWVESTLGQGSTFYFTLPLYEPAAKGVCKPEPEQDLDPGRKAVLVVDDDASVITLLTRYLENDGYQVIGVTESLHALETAQRLAPDLAAITLDVLMPEMDGWQVLQALKHDPTTENIPVIVCSIADDLDQGAQLGASDHLHKPVTRDELLHALRQLERA
jgi:signal transduction histidine kinase/HAMP domain-containing protein